MDASTLAAFLAAALVITVTPGPAVALILRRAALRGYRSTVPLVLGLELGLFVWVLLAGAGLAALVATSQLAYTVLRVVGAGVLVFLGARALRTWWRARADGAAAPVGAATAPRTDRSGPPSAQRPPRMRGAWSGFAEGLLVQLANPKAAVFVFAFYPPFIPPDAPQLPAAAGLGALHVALETVLYLGLAFGVGSARGLLGRPAVRHRLELVSGAVLVGLGLRVAAASR